MTIRFMSWGSSTTIAPVMRYEMTLAHVLMFISFLNLTSINTVRTKIKVRVFYK